MTDNPPAITEGLALVYVLVSEVPIRAKGDDDGQC